MIYLSGTLHRSLYGEPHIGMMLSPASKKPLPPGIRFALDNGAFVEKYPGDESFLYWIDRVRREGCLFTVAPDVVGNAAETWRRSAPMLARIRALGFPVALAAQNGWSTVPVDWDAFDAVLLGGDDVFKLGWEGRQAAHDATTHGKWLHMGRVNSYRRIAYADGLGCESADGTTVTYNPARYVPEIRRWMARINAPRLMGREECQ